MIEELILAGIGFIVFSRGRFCWEEAIGVGLGSGFVVMVLLIISHFMPGQEDNLSVFMRLMVFGYLPTRVFSWIGDQGFSNR